MQKVAIISDIHGNITALEAVLHTIKSQGITTIFCLGDLVGKGPNSKKAIELIREHCEVTVRGNWDEGILEDTDNKMMNWHKERIGEEGLAYLESLPFHHDFYMSGYLIRLLHASAKSVHHRVIPMVHPNEEILAMFHNTPFITTNQEPDIVGYGDIHAALLEAVGNGKTLFNAGSVGNPLDVPQATFVILHGHYQSQEKKPFSIEIVRVPYDIEKEIVLAEQAGMPAVDAYALELRTAIYRWSAKGKQLLNITE